MNTAVRAAGTVIVYMAGAIIAEVIAMAALTLINGGRFPGGSWLVVIVLVGLVAGLVIAIRYWSETEFIGDRLLWTPLFLLLMLVLVLAVSSLFLARPISGPVHMPAITGPQTSPSALPALPPAPAHDLQAQFISTTSGGN